MNENTLRYLSGINHRLLDVMDELGKLLNYEMSKAKTNPERETLLALNSVVKALAKQSFAITEVTGTRTRSGERCSDEPRGSA